MTHTPGPWALGNENNACCDVQAGPVTISLDRMDILGRVAISREEMLANAHLVISAPDLLAALRELMEFEGAFKTLTAYSGSSLHGAVKQARAAIARLEAAQ